MFRNKISVLEPLNPEGQTEGKSKILIINTGGTFGFNPENGTFPNKLLEKYLKTRWAKILNNSAINLRSCSV